MKPKTKSEVHNNTDYVKHLAGTWLAEPPFGQGLRKMGSAAAYDCFSFFLPSVSVEDREFKILSRFATAAPWTYWSSEKIEEGLRILESDPSLTWSAIQDLGTQLGLATEVVLRPGRCVFDEETIRSNSPSSLVKLSNEFHPEYLKYAEHAFGNMIRLYWSASRGKRKSYNLKGAISFLKSSGSEKMLTGYHETVRNALAHGRVEFRGEGVRYYTDDSYYDELTPSEFLKHFDDLINSTHSLFVALLLFILRNFGKSESSVNSVNIPHQLLLFIAEASVKRDGLKVIGSIESDYPQTGKQLQISVTTSSKSRYMAFLDTIFLTSELFKLGVGRFDRFLFEFDQGASVSSMTCIQFNAFKDFLLKGAQKEDLRKVFDGTQLLWFHESAWRTRLRLYSSEMKSLMKNCVDEIVRNFHSGQSFNSYLRCHVKTLKTLLPDKTLRVEAIAFLKYSQDAENS